MTAGVDAQPRGIDTFSEAVPQSPGTTEGNKVEPRALVGEIIFVLLKR
jgi:hypothetical protein